MSFAEASAVHHQGGPTWTGYISPGWDIFGNADGGYLMAMVSRAMSEAAGGRIPISVTAHFLRPGKPGPVTIETVTIRTGRAISTVRADMRTTDRVLLTALGSFADPSRDPGEALIIHSSPPDLPPREECIRAEPSKTGPLPPPFMGRVEELLHPDDAVALSGERTGIARIRGWMRLPEGEPMDVFTLLLAADAFPPAIFNTNLPLVWTPTLELTTHVRGGAPSGWLRCRFRTRFVTGGYLEEDGEIWDEEGRLVAQSRQLALVPSRG